jgi:O-antigen/teichoic acid export membrane protein
VRAARAEFGRYATRMQVSSLTAFANGEADALIVGAMLPIRYVGLYAVGYQVATAARSLPLYAFPPMLSRLSAVFARSGADGARTEFTRLQQRWAAPVLGYGVVAGAGIVFAVPAWLGAEYAIAGVVGAVLALGYTTQGALTGVRTCYVRAVARPGLETRYAVLSTIINVALTIPLAYLFGVVGVVSATTVALVIASLYFVRLCTPLGLEERAPSRLWLSAIPVALGVVVAGELAIRTTGWLGVPGLLAAGIPVLAGCGVLAMAALRLARRGTAMTAATPSEARR